MALEVNQHDLPAKPKLFIDSGAYSAETKGARISPYQYAAFIKRWANYPNVVCNLDVIGDAEATWKNQVLMEELGVTPMPTFHYGEDYKWLIRYVEKYPYIALGGQVGQSTENLIKWLDEVWDQYLTNGDGLPVVKVHAFGVTSPVIMCRYPWHSVDSTSWLLAAAMGKVQTCVEHEPGDYSLLSLAFSDKSPDMARNQHIDSLTPNERSYWEKIIAQQGFSFEALQTDYRERFFCNAKAYVDFASLTKSYKPFFTADSSLFPITKAFESCGETKAWPHLTMFLAGNPGASLITKGLMEKGYNRLLSYHYIAESMSHFNEAREVLDKWQTT